MANEGWGQRECGEAGREETGMILGKDSGRHSSSSSSSSQTSDFFAPDAITLRDQTAGVNG